MSRPPRPNADGLIFHVLNRGNTRQTVFHNEDDYLHFLMLLGMAKERFSFQLFALCLMPNHFHLLLRPEKGKDLSRLLHWLTSTYVRHHHHHHAQSGHLWQGRFKSFVVQDDAHFLTVARYIERNPLHASLVSAASDWPWSSHTKETRSLALSLTDPWPLPRPKDWMAFVDAPLTDPELESIRYSLDHQAPFGDPVWRWDTARALGMEMTLHRRGPHPSKPR